jgi:hypothetical protein
MGGWGRLERFRGGGGLCDQLGGGYLAQSPRSQVATLTHVAIRDACQEIFSEKAVVLIPMSGEDPDYPRLENVAGYIR